MATLPPASISTSATSGRRRTVAAPVHRVSSQQEQPEMPSVSRASSVTSAPSTVAESLRSYWDTRRGTLRRLSGNHMFRAIHRTPISLRNTPHRSASTTSKAFIHTSAKVNASVSRLVNLIIRDFIQEWYEKVTDDKEFLSEVSMQLKLVINDIERRCRKADWVQFLLFEVPDMVHLHVRDAHQCVARLGTVYVGRETSIEAMFQSMQPHVALAQAADSELAYLRLLSNELLTVFMPPEAQNDEVVLNLVREILACAVLRNVVDAIADPSTLNEGIVRALGKHSKKEYFRNADMSRYITQPMCIDADEDSAVDPSEYLSDPDAPNATVETMLRDAQTSQISSAIQPPTLRKEPLPAASHPINHSAALGDAQTVGKPAQGNLTELLSSQLSFASWWLISDLFSQARWRGWKNNTIRWAIYLHLIVTQTISRIFSMFSEYTFSLNQLWQPDTVQTSYRGAIHPILGLVNTFLLLDLYNQWAWAQFIFYIFPLINLIAGAAIDRTLVKVLWFLLGEQQIASYVDLIVDSLWKPENGGKFKSGNKPYKTLEQEEMLRRDAAELVAELLPYVATRFFYGQSEEDRLLAAQRILEPFENRQLNKHLVYNILDSIIGKIAPELRESGSQNSSQQQL
ncbi:PXA domain-containing protein [Kickxella alabastrina]|uniref:PXA domain-containing protein n=1 Tax=Kickxella alabastrina TaxID=61397 RepID=UPI00221E893B|nr:PXA domain-containing protein [Kickxella alabastrina]KAI7821821.1 PXA domain-containing protein [Kickxella alabastrina]